MKNSFDEKKQSIIIFIFLTILTIGSIFFGYYKYILEEDFLIYAQVSCDPEIESCFVYEDGEEIWDYKIIYKKAYQAPKCEPLSEEGCPELSCGFGEKCEVVTCSLENVTQFSEADYCS